MAHAEKCPICYGNGEVQDPDGISKQQQTCHGCGGSGWVSVQDEVVGWPVYPSSPYPITFTFPEPSYPNWSYLENAGFNSKTAVL